MCNAWNHWSGCTCGWGGGGWRHAPTQVRRVAFVDGLNWRRGRNPTFDSYTIPNAKCPVCGATVFFYQSPHGGRVFFDTLGPPWPKHPCTDIYFRSTQTRIVAPADPLPPKRPTPLWARDGWVPLIVGTVKTEQRVTIISCVEATAQIRHSFGLREPHEVNVDSPLFYRRLADSTGRYEIAFVSDGRSSTDVLPATSVVCPKVHNAAGLALWEAALTGDTEAGNHIGMRLSFSMDSELARKANIFPDQCDWDAAEWWFRKAADEKYWAAQNNLGVIHLNGFGRPQNDKEAFEFLTKAAESLKPTPLRHLAVCYAEGRGVRPDLDMAAYLRELADVQEVDEK